MCVLAVDSRVAEAGLASVGREEQGQERERRRYDRGQDGGIGRSRARGVLWWKVGVLHAGVVGFVCMLWSWVAKRWSWGLGDRVRREWGEE